MTSLNLQPDERADRGLHRFLSLSGGDRDVPPDVEPGSDADIYRDDEDDEDEGDAGSEAAEPSPGDDAVTDTEQMDDNIDDLGRRPDGSRQEQPGISKPD